MTRILVWRHLRNNDLNIPVWTPILHSILEKHARLGNDSEVCWAVYAFHMLEIQIPLADAVRIVQNCGALSIVAVLNCVSLGLVPGEIFATARARLEGESANGRYWPLFLEWISREWPGHEALPLDNEVIQFLCAGQVKIYDPESYPLVFRDLEEGQFNQVARAIERRSSMYEDEEEPNLPDADEEEPF